jgi:hypothetical protein
MSRFSRYYSEGSKRLSIVRSGYCFSFATSANRMDGQNIWPTDEGCMWELLLQRAESIELQLHSPKNQLRQNIHTHQGHQVPLSVSPPWLPSIGLSPKSKGRLWPLAVIAAKLSHELCCWVSILQRSIGVRSLFELPNVAVFILAPFCAIDSRLGQICHSRMTLNWTCELAVWVP